MRARVYTIHKKNQKQEQFKLKSGKAFVFFPVPCRFFSGATIKCI